MYKQCFELLTAQGPKPHKSFSVGQGAAEVAKDYDPEIKGNIFSLANQRIQLPPNPQQLSADFHNTGNQGGSKRVGVASSLNIVHQFLVFQVFIPSGESFSIELHVRDKHNTRRRLMLSEGTKSIVTNQMHARIPNSCIARDKWINLCIDVNSFIRECFSRTGAPYGTPQINPNGQPMANGQRANVGGGSGDIASLHSGKVGDITGTQISKVAAVMAKNAQSATSNNQNSMKTIEIIQLEGTFKIRKIFTSRSQIPADLVENPFGSADAGATVMSGGTMRAQDIISAAMVGQRIEQIPKNFDYGPQIQRLNQVISYDIVNSACEPRISATQMPEDAMQVTGLRMTSNTNNEGAASNFPNQLSQQQHQLVQDFNSNDSQSNHNDFRNSYLNSNALGPTGMVKTGLSGLKVKTNKSNAFPKSIKDRNSSVNGEAISPSRREGMGANAINLNSQFEGVAFRKNANQSKQANASVIVVDQENVDHARHQQNSQLRSSGKSIRQGQSSNNNQMRIMTHKAASNITGESGFKQAHSTTSGGGQRSNQTQSTAYSVRTTSSGRQQKSKLVSGGGPNGYLQTSQSPFTDNNSGGGGTNNNFTRKRSLHGNNGRPVYEQVDEMEESGSGHVSLKLGQAQQQTSQENRIGNSTHRTSSPEYSAQGSQQNNHQNSNSNNAQSAKVPRKAFAKTKIDTNLPHSSEKMQSLSKNDTITTPKLHQLQEVHQTTILEENETMRGSIDRHPHSKLGRQVGSNAKKFNRIQQAENKKGQMSNNQSASAAARKAPSSGVYGKNVRTKSVVGGQTIQEQASNTSSSIHPLVKAKAMNAKVSVSSSNLEDSIGGIIGSKIQSRQSGFKNSNKQNQGQFTNNNKAISPVVGRKSQLPKNQLHVSNQKKRNVTEGKEQPQFQVRNGRQLTNNNGGKNGQNSTNQQAQFLYNGSGFGSQGHQQNNQMNGIMDSDGEQSDFKTTTLRFTNNNFISNDQNKKDRDPSTGAIAKGNVSAYIHNPQNSSQYVAANQNSLMNTLNSQNNQVQQLVDQNRRNDKQFGTSDNFKAGAFNIGYDQRTDGFSRLRNNQSKSPVNNRQFSTMHGMMQSDGQVNDDQDEEEELIEEDICDHDQSPLINAQTKQATGQKARVLFHGQQPPAFRSTESEQFNLDTMMTGFGHNKNIGEAQATGFKEKTPFQDKSSILASKPYLGGKPRHQLIKSPERAMSGYGNDYNSAGGGIASEMRQVNHRELQKEIEEEIGVREDSHERDHNALIDSSQQKNCEIDPTDTCTSDFYQVPIQGGIPVQLTIENGRRPFTPPFAQLIKVTKPPTGQSSRSKIVPQQSTISKGNLASNAAYGVPETSTQVNANKQPPAWISPAAKAAVTVGIMSSVEKDELQKNVGGEMIAEGDEDHIEEEIEGIMDQTSPHLSKEMSSEQSKNGSSSKAATTKHSSSDIGSRNKKNQEFHTFAEEPIEFSESFKRKEGVNVNGDSMKLRKGSNNPKDMYDQSGSNTHTFGRRSRAEGGQPENNDDENDDEDNEEELDREQKTQSSLKIAPKGGSASQYMQIQEQTQSNEEAISSSIYQKDVIDPQTAEQKKRLLYDKSLKAYYDPETGQYFEMKQQLISQASLGQLEPTQNKHN